MVLSLYLIDFSCRSISKTLSNKGFTISKSAVNNIIRRYEEEKTLENKRKGNCGRKPLIGTRTKGKILNAIQKNRELSIRDIKNNKKLNPNHYFYIS